MFSANQGTLVSICKLMHFDGAQKQRWVLYVAYGLLIPCATLIECALVRIKTHDSVSCGPRSRRATP